MRFKLLPRATRDLAEIQSYIRADNEHAAKAVALRLRDSLKLIASRPDLGRMHPNSPIREWSVPGLPYLIPYRIRGDVVEILRIFHTSRKRPDAW